MTPIKLFIEKLKFSILKRVQIPKFTKSGIIFSIIFRIYHSFYLSTRIAYSQDIFISYYQNTFMAFFYKNLWQKAADDCSRCPGGHMRPYGRRLLTPGLYRVLGPTFTVNSWTSAIVFNANIRAWRMRVGRAYAFGTF